MADFTAISGSFSHLVNLQGFSDLFSRVLKQAKILRLPIDFSIKDLRSERNQKIHFLGFFDKGADLKEYELDFLEHNSEGFRNECGKLKKLINQIKQIVGRMTDYERREFYWKVSNYR